MQEQQKRRGIPFLKKVLLLLIVLGIFASIGIWYANEYILPVKGKAFAIEYLTKATGREVTLESIYYNPFRGITLRNLTFSDDLKYNRKFLEIKKLYFNILYIPLFEQKKIIIPLIKIESPKFVLTVDSDNKWNFESLLFLNQPDAQPQQYSVLVYNISVSNAACMFEDRALEPAFSKEIKNLDFQTSISYPLKIKYKLNSELEIGQKNSISADGEFDPLKKEMILNLRLKNVPFAEFQPYYTGLPFKSMRGNLSGNVSLLYVPENRLTIEALSTVNNLNIINEGFVIKGSADLSGRMVVELKDKAKMPCVISAAAKIDSLDLSGKDFSLTGGADANGKFTFDAKDKTTLKYSADALLRDAKIKGVPNFDVIDKINGKLYLNEARLWADSIKGTSRSLDLIFAGSLKDYANPYLDLTAKTELDLSRINEFLDPELSGKLKNYAIAGRSRISLNVSGSLNNEKIPLAYILTSELLNCSVKPDFLDKPVTSISGILISKDDSVNLKNISAAFDNTIYNLNGNITGLKTPTFDLSVASEDLKLETVFRSLDSALTFSKFAGKYKNTQFAIAGSFTDFKDPVLNIRGSVNTEIGDLRNYLPKDSADLLSKIGEGTLSTDFGFNGRWKDRQTWQLDLSKFEGKNKNGRFNLIGSVNDFKDPLLKIRGSLVTDINEIKKWIPKQNAEIFDKLEVSGAVSTKFVFDGKWNDQNAWHIEAVAESPQLIVKKLKFDNLSLEYKLKDNFISMPRITAAPYGGSLTANVAIDCTQKNPQYVIELDIKDVDLSKWKNDTDLKDKDLRGLFYATAQFGGFGDNIETLRGKGQFAITNGKFWELPVFSGLANILYIPGVSKIVFGEARGNFTVGNKVIYTSDTELRSSQMNLVGDGTVDFDGNLNFNVTAAFDKGLLDVPSALGPIRDLFVDKEGNYLGDIKLDGTTKDPKFKINPLPIDKIFNNNLFKGLLKGSPR